MFSWFRYRRSWTHIAAGMGWDIRSSRAGEKSVTMIRQKDLLSLTGYVHGGCSPVGMKKSFPTFFHKTAEKEDQIFVSAGKVGFQVGVNPKDLSGLVRFTYVDLAADD